MKFTRLIGREKVVWLTVANKVNEIIDFLNEIQENESFKAILTNKKEMGNGLHTPQTE